MIACARTRLAEAAATRIREIAAQPIDWSLLLRTAAVNSVLPLLARNLPVAAPEAFTAEQFDQLRKAARASGIRSLQLAAELIRVMDLFCAEGVLALPYKGPALAAQAYSDLALREFEDLDILLPQRDVARAAAILADLSYKPRFPWVLSREANSVLVPGEYNFADQERSMMIELHSERTLRHFPVMPDFDEMAKNLEPVRLSGREIKTFSAEDMLVLLCIHGSKDFWERLSWIADISEFVQSQPALDWDRVLRRAGRLKAQRMLYLGLALAAQILEAPIPAHILKRADGDAVIRKQSAEIERRHLSESGNMKMGAAWSFGYRRDMVPGFVAGWRYALRLASAPAEEDWMMMKLPRALSPLYIFLRPLRLLRKHSSRTQLPTT